MEKIILNFIFNEKEIKLQCNKNEYMKDIFKRYLKIIEKDIKDVYFLFNGNIINKELKLDEINGIKNNNKIIVSEIKEREQDKNKDNKKHIKDIICPICSESCIINFDDYKIKLNQCKNGHEMSNILFNEFKDVQNINESKLKCCICNKSKLEIPYNKLYKCCNCNFYLCPICKLEHNKVNNEHIIIDYELKNYLCNIHGEKYISYCQNCNKDLCYLII